MVAVKELRLSYHNSDTICLILPVYITVLGNLNSIPEQQPRLAGLPDKKGRLTAIGSNGYMWESLPTTLQRIVGEEVGRGSPEMAGVPLPLLMNS